MVDPLAQVVTLLQPQAEGGKLVTARGRWRVHRSHSGNLFYCAILEGKSRIDVEGHAPLVLEAGDFVLVPPAVPRTASSLVPAKADTIPVQLPSGDYRHGERTGKPDLVMVVGFATFGSPDAALLLSLFPKLVHVRGEARLATLVQLVGDESRATRPAREVVLARLLEVLLIEALRTTSTTTAHPGLLRGLADEQLATAIRRIHESPAKPWTIAQLAKAAGVSRSTFFERFTRAVGVAPIEYLLGWRMALAKDLLRRTALTVGEIAPRVGYSSASTFSVAFTRFVGTPPSAMRRASVDLA